MGAGRPGRDAARFHRQRRRDASRRPSRYPAQLEKSGVQNILDLTKIAPGFTTTRQSEVSSLRLNIRGVGASTQTAVEPSMASFLDDVYVSRPGSITSHFYDVESIEVLRGPQGTLFGRNASVGALSIHTQKPTNEFGVNLNAEASSFDTYQLDGAVNVPVADWASVRAAGIVATTNGPWYTTIGNHRYGGLNTYGGRLTAKLEPAAGLTWILRGDYMKLDGDGSSHNTVVTDTVTPTAAANFAARQGGLIPDLYNEYSRTSNNYVQGGINDHQYGLTSDLSYKTSGGFTFRLIDAKRDWSSRQTNGDVAFTARPLIIRDETQASNSQSHELQFISPPDALLGGHLSFVGGLYYFREHLSISERLNFTADTCNYVVRLVAAALVPGCLATPQTPATRNDFNQVNNSYAAYAQATIKILPKLDLDLGGRYTKDRKSGTFVQTVANAASALLRVPENTALRSSDGRFTYRVNLSYRPSSAVHLYANYSTGFKSGGFNSGGGTSVLGQSRIFQPETVDDYEAGVKTRLLNGLATLDVDLYRMDVHNYQDRSYDGLNFLVRNAADLRSQGVEAQGTLRPADWLRLSGSLAYLDSKFLRYPGASGLPGFGGTQDLAGKRNNFAPKWQGNVGAEVTRHVAGLGVSLRSDVNFISNSNLGSTTDANPQSVQKGYALLNARLIFTLPGDRYSVQLFANNLTDKRYCTFIFPNTIDNVFGLRNAQTGGTLYRCELGMPRSIGARLTASF